MSRRLAVGVPVRDRVVRGFWKEFFHATEEHFFRHQKVKLNKELRRLLLAFFESVVELAREDYFSSLSARGAAGATNERGHEVLLPLVASPATSDYEHSPQKSPKFSLSTSTLSSVSPIKKPPKEEQKILIKAVEDKMEVLLGGYKQHKKFWKKHSKYFIKSIEVCLKKRSVLLMKETAKQVVDDEEQLVTSKCKRASEEVKKDIAFYRRSTNFLSIFRHGFLTREHWRELLEIYIEELEEVPLSPGGKIVFRFRDYDGSYASSIVKSRLDEIARESQASSTLDDKHRLTKKASFRIDEIEEEVDRVVDKWITETMEKTEKKVEQAVRQTMSMNSYVVGRFVRKYVQLHRQVKSRLPQPFSRKDFMSIFGAAIGGMISGAIFALVLTEVEWLLEKLWQWLFALVSKW